MLGINPIGYKYEYPLINCCHNIIQIALYQKEEDYRNKRRIDGKKQLDCTTLPTTVTTATCTVILNRRMSK